MAKATEEKVVNSRLGRVVSDARQKTRKVEINYSTPHDRYSKVIRCRTSVHVHDEENVSKKGDLVRIKECRPMSKTKTWMLMEVVEKAAIDELSSLKV